MRTIRHRTTAVLVQEWTTGGEPRWKINQHRVSIRVAHLAQQHNTAKFFALSSRFKPAILAKGVPTGSRIAPGNMLVIMTRV